MQSPHRISLIFGTRPEAVKLCPLIHALQRHSDLVPHVCVTGQHRELLDQVLEAFDVVPDVDLSLMQPDQNLASLSARAIAWHISAPPSPLPWAFGSTPTSGRYQWLSSGCHSSIFSNVARRSSRCSDFAVSRNTCSSVSPFG